MDQPSKPRRRNRAAARRRASPRQRGRLGPRAAAFLVRGVRVLLPLCLALHLCFTCGLCSWVSWPMNVVLFVTQQAKRCLLGCFPQRLFPCFFALSISVIRKQKYIRSRPYIHRTTVLCNAWVKHLYIPRHILLLLELTAKFLWKSVK